MNSEIGVIIPMEFQKMNSMPGDPENSVVYGKQTSSANCFFIMHPIRLEEAMPFDSEQSVIDGIHDVLAEDQGLVEVKSGITNNERKYIYSIVKTRLNPSGIQYVLTLHIHYSNYSINLQAYFDEVGITGKRDTTILNMLMGKENSPLKNMDTWMRDPYNQNYKRGLLMNLSEEQKYDEMFPEHPLSEMRKLIKYVIEKN